MYTKACAVRMPITPHQKNSIHESGTSGRSSQCVATKKPIAARKLVT
jgi:hypothetical protein